MRCYLSKCRFVFADYWEWARRSREECGLYMAVNRLCQERGTWNELSLAVFAFAVEDMKARDIFITSARPFAFLCGGKTSLGSPE